ncbi:MAG: EF-P lysine aminoacylase EpmA [Gammaproteobacteria bacterium]|nr:EF-P lysine aminoacylase EpmA [Gammaproteobacteria bacterium]
MKATESWRPSASLETLRARAGLLTGVREFFQRRGVMEVETPVCSRFGVTDPAIESFTTRYAGPAAPPGRTLYLHTSPEFPMKRLLAAGAGPIYQICKVFRGGELGAKHNPEFTLLEWYRPGFDHHRLMDEVAELVNSLMPHQLEVEKLTYAEVFRQALQLDPHTATLAELRRCAREVPIPGAAELELVQADAWLDLLLTHVIEPQLGRARMTFLYEYPASQAALARIIPSSPPLAERFELYLAGVEIANGFNELTDAQEQRNRFEQENSERSEQSLAQIDMDLHLLAALEAGLPACAGVALGIDRLLMQITQKACIEEVLSFGFERA